MTPILTMKHTTTLVLALATSAAALVAQQPSPPPQPAPPAPYPVGNRLGLPILPAADGRFAPMSPNVKVYGSVYSAESCSYDAERGLIVVPNRGVSPNVRANDAWITLLNHDGSVHTSRWIGVQNAGGQRDSLTPPLVLNEPFGSDIVNGVLYLADRDGGTTPADTAVNVVRRFDLRTGAPMAGIRVPGAPWFNDIAVTGDGTVYGTATGAGQLWRVSPSGEARVFVQGAPLNRPNGVAIDGQGGIVVVNSGSDSVLTYSSAGTLVRTERAAQSGSDGIVIVPDGTKYVSSVVNGGVSRLRPGQRAELIAENIPNAASMCLDSGANQLVIPMNANNALAFVSLNETNDPFPEPIEATEGVIVVTLREFASLPDVAGVAARAMTLVEEPVSKRLFVSDMHGLLYALSADGKTVQPYLDLRDARWRVPVQSRGRERGMQSFVLHPQFAQRGAPGFGRFYTYTDITDQAPPADFRTPRDTSTHDLVLHEWKARTPSAAAYDGDAPRELMRFRQPYANHNGGAIAFNPTARAGSADFGMLYVSVGDGGSGGDPMGVAPNLGNAFGKLLRIDPLGTNGRNGRYGIPATNPFTSRAGVLPEIYAYGIRNAQRLGWDPKDGAMYLSDIGQNIVEEVSPVSAGANLGWNRWEGSYRYASARAVRTDSVRGDASVTYPVVEYGQIDPVLLSNASSASVGVVFYRSNAVPQLNGKMLFGDMPSGEMFHVSADRMPEGGQDAVRRVLFRTASNATPRKFLEIVQEKNVEQGKQGAQRADLRFDAASAGRVFVLNKADGVVRVVER